MNQTIQNYTFDELKVGMSARLTHTLTHDDIKLFAAASGDPILAGLAEDITLPAALGKRPTHAALSCTLLSRLIGTDLPGPGTSIVAESIRYQHVVGLGDSVTVSVTVREKRAQNNIVILDCAGTNQHGDPVLTGTMEVSVLTQKFTVPRMEPATISVQEHDSYEAILRACKNLPAVVTAVAHPCDESSLTAVLDAAEAGLIVPILVGPADRIRKIAKECGFDISRFRVDDTPYSHASAARAVELVREGEAEVLMKGSLHTDELMSAVVSSTTGLRTGRVISHVFVMDVPTYPKPLFVTDAAINIYPTLEQKVDIVQNAIDLAHALRIPCPKVAILSAVETVTPKIQSTLEAAALCKMADRGQITGALLDGPLAMDNAISKEAAAIKKITSAVAGDADILLVPDLEAGNILAKQLTFMANADAAGIVLGARVPIILTSRADNLHARMASCAVAVILANVRREAAKVAPV
ncbi:MAG: bifunctional enoyl-CoA hydratase/phosphate acetyltransferase [Burkholderiales bacterium]|jgi:phosphate acetyltransferase|nr:bifunctional enoyl-CoA hydratase/phosphate acetyltransferase [Burkholderiales bacterium]